MRDILDRLDDTIGLLPHGTPEAVNDVLGAAADEIERLRAELEAAIAAERERCAKVCQDVAGWFYSADAASGARACAAAIRGGGE